MPVTKRDISPASFAVYDLTRIFVENAGKAYIGHGEDEEDDAFVHDTCLQLVHAWQNPTGKSDAGEDLLAFADVMAESSFSIEEQDYAAEMLHPDMLKHDFIKAVQENGYHHLASLCTHAQDLAKKGVLPDPAASGGPFGPPALLQ